MSTDWYLYVFKLLSASWLRLSTATIQAPQLVSHVLMIFRVHSGSVNIQVRGNTGYVGLEVELPRAQERRKERVSRGTDFVP